MPRGIAGLVVAALGVVAAVAGFAFIMVVLMLDAMGGDDPAVAATCVVTADGGGDGEAIPEKWREDVEAAAAEAGVPTSVLAAQIAKESGWDEGAVNTSSGAAGLTQFMPPTWAAYGEGDPLDGKASIKAMGKYMAELMRLAGDAGLEGEERLKGALAAYNWGPGSMAGNGWSTTEGLPAETSDYLSVILGDAQVNYSETCAAPAVGAGGAWDGDLGDGEWTHPLPGSSITSAGAYGPRNIPGYPAWANNHAGIDFATPKGDGTVIAPMDMRVTAIFDLDGCVLGKATTGPAFGVEFCHLDAYSVQAGDELKRGDIIGKEGGKAGSLGGRSVVHLHYAMYDPSAPDPQYPGHQNPVIDPTPLLIEKGVL
jgi:hypothetical protein